MSATSSADKETAAAADFVDAPKNLAPAALFAHIVDRQTTALKALSNILKRAMPTAAPAETTTIDLVGLAQQVLRVENPGKARQQPLLRVP